MKRRLEGRVAIITGASRGLGQFCALGIAANALQPLSAIETPGYLFAQLPRGKEQAGVPALPPPDSYVEAALILARQTPQTYSGQINNDAEVIANLAGDETKQRFRELNPDYWTVAMDKAAMDR